MLARWPVNGESRVFSAVFLEIIGSNRRQACALSMRNWPTRPSYYDAVVGICVTLSCDAICSTAGERRRWQPHRPSAKPFPATPAQTIGAPSRKRPPSSKWALELIWAKPTAGVDVIITAAQCRNISLLKS